MFVFTPDLEGCNHFVKEINVSAAMKLYYCSSAIDNPLHTLYNIFITYVRFGGIYHGCPAADFRSGI